MSSLGPLFPAFLVIAAMSWLTLRDGKKIVEARGSARWLIGGSAVTALFMAWQVLVPAKPLTQMLLEPSDPPMHVEAGGRLALLVHANLPSVEQGAGASARYTLEVRSKDAAGEKVATLRGHMEEQWTHRRVAKRGSMEELSVHDEDRFELPSAPLDIRVLTAEGNLAGPLQLSIVPVLLPDWLIDGLGVVLTLGAVLLEGREAEGTSVGRGVGTIATFAMLLVTLTPSSPGIQVFTMAIAALFLGGGLATLAVLLARRFLHPTPATPVASATP